MHCRIPVVAFLLAIPLLAQAPTISTPTFHRARAVWFVQDTNPVGAEVGFGVEELAWTKDTEKAFAGASPGTRIALGSSMWAALETFSELKFGKVEVKAGNHYAVLAKTKDGFALELLDPDAVRKAQEAPGIAKAIKSTATIALLAEKADESPLRAEWQPGSSDGTAELTIRFGPHKLHALATVAGSKGGSPVALPDPRGTSRIAFGKNAFAVVDHGVPPWNEQVAAQANQLKAGTRWRLGKDWATTLDTNVPLAIGDKTLAAGSWHLTLARTDKGWNLLVSQAAADHKAKLDGFAAQYVNPVAETPLVESPAKERADKLRIEFAPEGKGTALAITFGDRRLAVPVAPAKT